MCGNSCKGSKLFCVYRPPDSGSKEVFKECRDTISLVETHLDSNISSVELVRDSWEIYRNDKLNRGGGYGNLPTQ